MHKPKDAGNHSYTNRLIQSRRFNLGVTPLSVYKVNRWITNRCTNSLLNCYKNYQLSFCDIPMQNKKMKNRLIFEIPYFDIWCEFDSEFDSENKNISQGKYSGRTLNIFFSMVQAKRCREPLLHQSPHTFWVPPVGASVQAERCREQLLHQSPHTISKVFC